AGLTATHAAPTVRTGETYLRYKYPVTGQAWGDYDGDGWVDLYVTDQAGPSVLYHNQGDGTFSVSELSQDVSLLDHVSGGAVFVDYDNDGWSDLYVLGYENDVLFRNEGGEDFADVTSEAGISEDERGMTASWGDYDQDGYLDLYVANNGCHPCDSPRLDEGDQDRLYHNEGDGTFTDVTEALKAEETKGWGFVAGWLDYDNDRDLDLYLVNDVRGTRYLHPNVLFRNDGPGCGSWCFTDVSEASGAGVRADGMGIAVGDYDNDQNLDLYFSNTGWAHYPLTGPAVLLRNAGDGSFEDASRESRADVDAVSWGTVFLDYDNDGFQDLYVALALDPASLGPHVKKNRLLRNLGDGTFRDTSATSGASHVDNTFGVASADYNNDGWTDLIAGNIGEGYDLYANAGTAGESNHRLTVHLEGGGPVNRDAVGARVYLTTTDGRTQLREVMAGSSLGAGNDLALNFGLGGAGVSNLRVLWPDGLEQTFEEVPSDVLWQLDYGGKPETSPLAEPSVPRMALGEPQQQSVSGGVRAGGYLVPVLALLSTLGLLGWLLERRLGLPRVASRVLVALVLGVISFQLAHFFEHLLQFGYWASHPGEDPWITPWGRVATDSLAALSGHHGGRATGTELLHLFGNWITFVGITAVYLSLRSWHVGSWRMRTARVAFWLQLVHVLEHVSLTTTFFALGTPIGLSTLFGHSFHIEGGWAPAIRIWWHFVMVLVPTVLFLLALREFRRAWLLTTTVPAGAPTAHEAPEHERAAKIPVGGRERRPFVGSGMRNSTGQGRR
ncbi:MAG: CRTAC1 family protein, partial [Actinomycetota bacterium]|nr:CRTAC1 family protein [Actinomycetota bacterium]